MRNTTKTHLKNYNFFSLKADNNNPYSSMILEDVPVCSDDSYENRGIALVFKSIYYRSALDTVAKSLANQQAPNREWVIVKFEYGFNDDVVKEFITELKYTEYGYRIHNPDYFYFNNILFIYN